MVRVLIAEDNLIIADMVEMILISAGYEVCGIARTVAEAVELARSHKPDLAVIDIRLAERGLGTEIAAQLSDLPKLGVLYTSGNLLDTVLTTIDGHACLAKPYGSADLVRSLEIVSDLVAVGAALPPFPRRFRLLRGGRPLSPVTDALISAEAAKVENGPSTAGDRRHGIAAGHGARPGTPILVDISPSVSG
jgi:CheY-like chemotaxis protein